ncbi:MAG: L,D-transpeptidase [Verrucomicrobiota bacterium]
MQSITTKLITAAAIAGVTFVSFESSEAGIFRRKGPAQVAASRVAKERMEVRRAIPVSRRVRTSSQTERSSSERRGLLARLFKPSNTTTSSNFRSATPVQRKVYEPRADINRAVLASSNRYSNRVVIDISKQKAYLVTSAGRIAMESPVSTARTGKYTPRGTFYVTERVPVGKVSTIYGVGMPYWMRLNSTAFGMHAGHLPGYPASAGCIRFPSDAAQTLFNHTKSGTRVSIYSSWSGS